MSRAAPFVSVACLSLGLGLAAQNARGESAQPVSQPVSEPSPNVVGGSPAPAGKWPDTAAIMEGGIAICTGTLVAPRVVLTAGHCVEGINVDQVKLDATDSSGPGEVVSVTQAIAYPNWETTYDIAVLVLAEDATVAPRAVATDCVADAALVDGAMVQLVGFGATTVQGEDYNTTLMEGRAQIMDSDCTGGDGCMAPVSPGGEFVAGGSVDSCYGDSGGPVYLDSDYGTVVAGVVSRGVDSSQTPCGDGGIYVRPDAVIDWIEQAAGMPVNRARCDTTPPGEDDPDNGDDVDEDGGDDTGDGGEGPDSDGPMMSGATGGCSASGTGTGGTGLLLLVTLTLVTVRRRAA